MTYINLPRPCNYPITFVLQMRKLSKGSFSSLPKVTQLGSSNPGSPNPEIRVTIYLILLPLSTVPNIYLISPETESFHIFVFYIFACENILFTSFTFGGGGVLRCSSFS